ncbi:MAG: carboxymuconolactone decarboxylase family protein [Haloferacaceae archaeon]
MTDPRAELESFETDMGEFAGRAPEVETFLDYVDAAEASAALDHETKELMSLAIGVVLRCEPCILWHTAGALDAGASPEAVEDALKVAVVMGAVRPSRTRPRPTGRSANSQATDGCAPPRPPRAVWRRRFAVTRPTV